MDPTGEDLRATVSGGIFISYRRDDAKHAAGRLAEHLGRSFPREQLFIDVDNIEPGLDFVRVLREQVEKCDVLLAVIGPTWADARDETGQRRLDNPRDFVRIEIETALARDIRVIPVLVDGARMPAEAELPETMHGLVTRNAVRLAHERFGTDAEGLTRAIARIVGPPPAQAPVLAPPSAPIGAMPRPGAIRLAGSATASQTDGTVAPVSSLARSCTVIASLVALVASLHVLLVYVVFAILNRWLFEPLLMSDQAVLLAVLAAAAAVLVSRLRSTGGLSAGLVWTGSMAAITSALVFIGSRYFGGGILYGGLDIVSGYGLLIAAIVVLIWGTLRMRKRSALLTAGEAILYGLTMTAAAFSIGFVLAGLWGLLGQYAMPIVTGLLWGAVPAAITALALFVWWRRREA